MKQLWTITSNGIGLLVVALGVILADNKSATVMTTSGVHPGTRH